MGSPSKRKGWRPDLLALGLIISTLSWVAGHPGQVVCFTGPSHMLCEKEVRLSAVEIAVGIKWDYVWKCLQAGLWVSEAPPAHMEVHGFDACLYLLPPASCLLFLPTWPTVGSANGSSDWVPAAHVGEPSWVVPAQLWLLQAVGEGTTGWVCVCIYIYEIGKACFAT